MQENIGRNGHLRDTLAGLLEAREHTARGLEAAARPEAGGRRVLASRRSVQVFITRLQLFNTLHSALSIEEEYEVPEERFGEDAVRQIVEQSATSSIASVPAREALAELSPYRLDFSNDLRADEFTRVFINTFHLQGADSKNRMRSDERLLQMLLLQWRFMISGDGIAFGNFSMGGGGEINSNGSAQWLLLLQRYEEQLRNVDEMRNEELGETARRGRCAFRARGRPRGAQVDPRHAPHTQQLRARLQLRARASHCLLGAVIAHVRASNARCGPANAKQMWSTSCLRPKART